jgi:hypothetical protein
MPMREPISKLARFTVFKRDSFTCQYCGRNPPAVVLEVDHIHPVSAGGKSQADNLLTACFDCNRGKGAELLSSIPESLEQRAAFLREKQDQVKAYGKLLRDIEKQDEVLLDRVESIFQRHFPTRQLSSSFRDSIKVNFVSAMAEDQLLLAMTRACIKRPDDAASATKYFCGVCWNMIKGTYGTRS